MTDADHDQVVRESFRHQVDAFSGPHSVYASREGPLGWIQPLDSTMSVLEVACGAAHAAESVAPAVRHTVGIDLTPELLDVAARRLTEVGGKGVHLVEGNAKRLPFPPASFDVTFCRSSLHHFADPGQAVHEMARVTKPGGRVVLIDLIAPANIDRERFDDLHRALDPSHVRTYTEHELDTAFPSEMTVVYADTSDFRFPIDVAVSEHSDGDVVFDALRAELAGGPATGFSPTADEDSIVVSFITRTVHATVGNP